MKEKWHNRLVHDFSGTYAYGCVCFEGQRFEPTTPDGFIRTRHRVQVRRLTGAGRIAVRRVNDDGTFGGEETWEA